MYDLQVKTFEDRRKDLLANIGREKNAAAPLGRTLKELAARLAKVQGDCSGFVAYHARTIKYLQAS